VSFKFLVGFNSVDFDSLHELTSHYVCIQPMVWQARNQLGTPGGAKSFLREAQNF